MICSKEVPQWPWVLQHSHGQISQQERIKDLNNQRINLQKWMKRRGRVLHRLGADLKTFEQTWQRIEMEMQYEQEMLQLIIDNNAREAFPREGKNLRILQRMHHGAYDVSIPCITLLHHSAKSRKLSKQGSPYRIRAVGCRSTSASKSQVLVRVCRCDAKVTLFWRAKISHCAWDDAPSIWEITNRSGSGQRRRVMPRFISVCWSNHDTKSVFYFWINSSTRYAAISRWHSTCGQSWKEEALAKRILERLNQIRKADILQIHLA